MCMSRSGDTRPKPSSAALPDRCLRTCGGRRAGGRVCGRVVCCQVRGASGLGGSHHADKLLRRGNQPQGPGCLPRPCPSEAGGCLRIDPANSTSGTSGTSASQQPAAGAHPGPEGAVERLDRCLVAPLAVHPELDVLEGARHHGGHALLRDARLGACGGARACVCTFVHTGAGWVGRGGQGRGQWRAVCRGMPPQAGRQAGWQAAQRRQEGWAGRAPTLVVVEVGGLQGVLVAHGEVDLVLAHDHVLRAQGHLQGARACCVWCGVWFVWCGCCVWCGV
jgi:hypothetical protein